MRRKMARAGNTVKGGPTKFTINETRPDGVTFHWIEDHELEQFVNITRPYSLALGTAGIGAALGLLPSIIAVIEKAASQLNAGDLIIVAAFAGTLVAGVIFGGFALRGLSDASKALDQIRARPSSPSSMPNG